jgi:large subunit ribosomal protein L10
MNRDQKTAVVHELAEQIRSAEAIIAVDYRGISVAEVADLRTKLRDAEARFRVVKNSLTERASDEAGAELLRPMLEGPTALTFISGDAALAAKALNDAARTLGTLEFKGGVMNGALLSAEEIRSLARLPSRDLMYAQLVGTIASPLSGLVRTLNALISGLAVQLQQVAEQGLVSGESPSTSEAPSASETEGEAPAAGASASDADDAPPEPVTESSEETETEAASDAEASEAKEEA